MFLCLSQAGKLSFLTWCNHIQLPTNSLVTILLYIHSLLFVFLYICQFHRYFWQISKIYSCTVIEVSLSSNFFWFNIQVAQFTRAITLHESQISDSVDFKKTESYWHSDYLIGFSPLNHSLLVFFPQNNKNVYFLQVMKFSEQEVASFIAFVGILSVLAQVW